jgi:hypothetical protein
VGGKESIVRWSRVAGLALTVATGVLLAPGIAGAAIERRGPPTHVPAPAQDNYTPTGPLVADSGFRPLTDGFSFANYGCDANTSDGTCIPPETDLTPTDVRTPFGDGVCSVTSTTVCRLSRPAQNWLDQANKSLSDPKGGHCFGFSVTSLELWKRNITPDQFGATSTYKIRLIGNQAIQREIAATFVTQEFSVQSALLSGTPNAVLHQLISVLTPNSADIYTIGFSNGKQGALQEGHAVTPYAVEDRGGGNYAVLIYDNNFPGVTRAMLFDTTHNTWSYELEPSKVWRGGAANPSIELAPMSASLGQQRPCPFCGSFGRAAPRAVGK